jgi:hypothetical protein
MGLGPVGLGYAGFGYAGFDALGFGIEGFGIFTIPALYFSAYVTGSPLAIFMATIRRAFFCLFVKFLFRPIDELNTMLFIPLRELKLRSFK